MLLFGVVFMVCVCSVLSGFELHCYCSLLFVCVVAVWLCWCLGLILCVLFVFGLFVFSYGMHSWLCCCMGLLSLFCVLCGCVVRL